MIAENINDVKKFMSLLLVGDRFDNFEVADVSITTYNTFHIDGHINKDFYTKEEYEQEGFPVFSKWSAVKPICYDIIKGKKTPLSFKIIFSMPEKDVISLIEQNNLNSSNKIIMDIKDINNLFLNIKYESGILSFVTGTSFKVFSMDKTLEQVFDKYIIKFISTLF